MIGETILHYKIIGKLGEGGMGEVFKAQDTKLDRFVALKFLPSQLTASEDDKARFIQEAKAATATNHPNVCTIYSIEEYNGQLFIAMEFVEGKTLKDKKESLSEKQILEIGIQVAEGLAAAHEKGIVHRDIKPENIMIRKDGIAQIMDFGLAKLYKEGKISRLTKAGSTVGTMGYMSPEQVQGLDADHRTDIFSLGVVLYELLADESPFKGVHETAIMYEIVNVDPPPISTLKEGIDPELDRIILECLEKDKDERCQSAKELAKDLRKVKKSTGYRKSRVYNANTGSMQTGSSNLQSQVSSDSASMVKSLVQFEFLKAFSSNYILLGLIGILALAVIYLALHNQNSEKNSITSVASISAPQNIEFRGNNADPGDFEIAHDGKTIVFVGTDSAGNSGLWLRNLNSEYARPITGTINAIYPFWSYDDKFIGYFNGNKLMKVNLNTGLFTEICSAQNGRGGSWNKNGEIIFAPNAIGGIYVVSSNGGTPKVVVKSDPKNKDQSLRFPFFLPDGKHFLYSIENSFIGSSPKDVVKVGSLNSDMDKVILNSSTNSQYSAGYIFFSKQQNLLCQKFDPDNFVLSGDIRNIAGEINYVDARIMASFSVSNSGNLVFQHIFQINSSLVLMNSRGQQTELPVKSEINGSIKINDIEAQLSPDAEKVLYSTIGNQPGNSEIWLYNRKSKINSKFTFNTGFNSRPCWSPDGKLVAFNYDARIYFKNADGSGSMNLLYKNDSSYFRVPDDWSSDGSKLLVNDLQPGTIGWELVIVNIKDKSKKIFLSDPKNAIIYGKFSKDMKWILYASKQSGSYQIYVRPLNSESGMWQVSTEGGINGWWVDNDKAIIYLSNDGMVNKVNVSTSGNNFIVGSSQLLFTLQNKNLYGLYDVSSDGNTFLAARPVSKTTIPPLTYIQNWKGLVN